VKFASTGAVIEDRYFIYDGWNVIEETIAPATGPVETAEHVWGTDLSGTAQGAGGVGGLLLRESSATGASYYHYDGNGNVTALTSGAGTVQAAYTYGPFGETLRAAGPLAQANPWRFSTKYQDDETGLLYYGYRFYNPTDGRWLNRDPIEEQGGINPYCSVDNNPTNVVDPYGLLTWNTNPAKWDTALSTGQNIESVSGGPQFTIMEGALAVTTIRFAITVKCRCKNPEAKPSEQRFMLAEITVNYHASVSMRIDTFYKGTTTQRKGKKQTQREWVIEGEQEHVKDFDNWAEMIGKPLALKFENTEKLKIASDNSSIACENRIRDAKEGLAPLLRASALHAIFNSNAKHDGVGTGDHTSRPHRWRGRPN
jgi:RHS repeat-associated protein